MMIKRVTKEDITDFLQMMNKLSSKKRKLINKSKQKICIEKTTSRIPIINNWHNSNKKELQLSIPETIISKPKVKNIDIAMIDADAYCAAYYLKKASLFTLSIRDIQYQVEKEPRADTILKNIISQV